jgi:hypothetical protein
VPLKTPRKPHQWAQPPHINRLKSHFVPRTCIRGRGDPRPTPSSVEVSCNTTFMGPVRGGRRFCWLEFVLASLLLARKDAAKILLASVLLASCCWLLAAG